MQNKSDTYKRPLKHKRIEPQALAEVCADKSAFQGWKIKKLSDISFPLTLKKEEIIIDFGGHFTGYLNIELAGRPEHIPDSPTNIAFSFAEMPIELAETAEDSENSLSVGWLQNDFKTIAFMPYKGSLERRYSFRYLKLKRTDSVRFAVDITALYIDAVSAVDIDDALPLNTADDALAAIDKICVNTLKECEQDVFEDGPKRDRRLWLGDLRLQALANYATFDQTDLVKRCLYLFAAMTTEEGKISANVFVKPENVPDDTFLFEYSLFFISTLYDLHQAHPDEELIRELYPIAKKQMNITLKMFDENGKLNPDENYPVFVDWSNDFNKDTAGQAEMIYVMKQFIELAKVVRDSEISMYEKKLELITDYAKNVLFHPEKNLFATAWDEYNIASQVWMVLAHVMSDEENKSIMQTTIQELFPVKNIATPYMYHHIVEALFEAGLDEEAVHLMKSYWGKMISLGADTYWEAFDPDQPEYSPYGSPIVNSYCHAWSCTPVYLLKKYVKNK